MKRMVIIFLLFPFLACDDDESRAPYKDDQLGCQYTNEIGADSREFVRCATYREFLAGGNVSAGGVASFTSSHTWIAVESCDDCK